LRSPAQDLTNPRGKIMRWNDDGTVPTDNPFVQASSVLPTICSYGHRNPQGFSFDRKTHELWSTEHGPRGGDELNWIRGGHNYGWPVISYGTRYDGLPVTSEVEHEGMDQCGGSTCHQLDSRNCRICNRQPGVILGSRSLDSLVASRTLSFWA
jgi:glucose/arabinose dehydrogenase